ncbi:hypothetical protein ACP70R_039273 [Stipagrostis hirtigluma subsp. patula]
MDTPSDEPWTEHRAHPHRRACGVSTGKRMVPGGLSTGKCMVPLATPVRQVRLLAVFSRFGAAGLIIPPEQQHSMCSISGCHQFAANELLDQLPHRLLRTHLWLPVQT